MPRRFTIELLREVDGRWIAEIRALLGVLVYGTTRVEAIIKVKNLAWDVLAQKLR